MKKSGGRRVFATGRRDTRDGLLSVRQGRRAFFHQLEHVVPEAVEELRALPLSEHEGLIVEATESARPDLTRGKWVSIRQIALPPNGVGPEESVVDQAGWMREFDDRLFVPQTIEVWARKWHLDTEWVTAFATLVRLCWRHLPERPLPDVLETLPGFPILRESGGQLRTSVEQLDGYPSIASADPRSETEADFVARAKGHYKQCSQFLNSFSVSIRDRDLSRDCKWLIRVQVLEESPSAIARSLRMSPQAINFAVHQLAHAIGLTLTELGPGRRTGIVEAAPRRRLRR